MIKTFKHTKIVVITTIALASILLVASAYNGLSREKALSIAYNEGLTTENRFSEMVELAYATEQSPSAFYILYSMLYHGQGTPAAPMTALIMLEKSAKAGYGIAQEELGFIYLNGNDYYHKDVNLAHHWLKKAALSGMPKSHDYLYSSS